MASDSRPPWTAVEAGGDAGSPLAVASIDGRCRDGDRTFVVVQGIRAWIEPFEMQRFQLMANVLQAQLIVAEVPGFGAAGTRLLSVEQRALLAGDFGPLAARMFEGVRTAAAGEDGGRPVSFLGYSMGASIVAAMAAYATRQGIDVQRVCLVEPVALHRWRISELFAANCFEVRRIDGYLAANDTVGGAVSPWDRRPGAGPETHRRRDVMLLGAAVSRGRLVKELLSGGLRHVVIVRGDQSRLSRGDLEPTLRRLREAGIAADELVVRGHHAFWHALPAVSEMTRRLRVLLEDGG